MKSVRSRGSVFFWFMAAYAVWHVAILGLLTLDFVTHPLAPDHQFGSTAFRLAFGAVVLAVGVVVSWLVIKRSPGNVVGLCLLLLLALAMGQTARPGSQVVAFANAANSGWTGIWLLGVFFPDGRTALPRLERPIRFLSAMAVAVMWAWPLFHASGPSGAWNPFHVRVLDPLTPIVDVLQMASLMPVVLLILPSLILRYRHGEPRTRLQLKWLAWVYGLLFALLIPAGTIGLIGAAAGPERLARLGQWAIVSSMLLIAYIALSPFIAVGNAILRHRLYDIEVIIRRTLLYGVLTALLGLVFFGSVLLLQQLFAAITDQHSPVAIVASTLVIAALFGPVRRRVQDFVDRRFYRRKYDAQQVLAQFAAIARDETDLERLAAELSNAVESTLQPSVAGIWLAHAGERREATS